MNVKQILIIIGLLLIIVYNSSVSRIEYFDNNNKSIPIILLGDSILNNNSYVKNGYAVDELLIKMCSTNPNINIVNYAREDSTISDVYTQLTHLDDIDYNLEYIIFLSVGGNNILENYNDVNSILENYKKLIDTIKTKLPASKLFVLNLYYTYDVKYVKLNHIVDKWNLLLYNYVAYSSLISGIVDINKLITSPKDLTFKIEPSELGGEKIASKIKDIIFGALPSVALAPHPPSLRLQAELL